jgi:hypothetical protein
MEASATTGTIERVSLDEPQLDTGKYKSGKKKGQRRPKKTAGVVVTNKEELLEAMKAFGLSLGTELRKPDVETEKERALQKLRNEQSIAHELRVVEEAKALQLANEAACEANGHRQDMGRSNRTAISGQIHGHGKNRKFIPICCGCNKVFPAREPGPDEQ